ncbi:MAG: serine/threonine-protein kinase [Acidobacteriota bacterium]
MNPERWREVDRLLEEALELPKVDVEAFLRRRCGDDHGLRHEVEDLLRAASESEGFLEGRVEPGGWLGDDSDAPEGEALGPYRVLRRLGGGGMADIFLAVRSDEAYERRVAVKRIRTGLRGAGPEGAGPWGTDLRQRFQREQAILARLEHPGIARLYDAGTDGGGHPYLVMELIDGERLDHYCDRMKLPLEQRLDLFVDLCSAVQFAHRNLLVHRDLKPSNILVTGDGELKLIDFGIAKDVAAADDLTRSAGAPMSLAYASPEQVRGDAISTASDIYSLGVVLYELLSGLRPYGGEPGVVDSGLSGHALARAVCETTPPLMSTALGQLEEAAGEGLAERRGLGHRDLGRRLRGDLDDIVAKATEKDVENRYPTVFDLAQDLDRHRRHLPIRAVRRGRIHRLRKFVRRHRVAVPVALAFAGLLLAFAFVQGEHARRMERERDKVTRAMDFLVDIFEESRPDSPMAAPANQLLDRAARRAALELRSEPDVQATLLDTLGRVYSNLGLIDSAEELLRQAVALRRRGSDPLELADSLSHLGSTLALRNDDDALDLFDEALREAGRSLSEGDPRIAEIQLAKAYWLSGLQHFDEAEALSRRALAAFEDRPGFELRAAEAQESLSFLLQQGGRGSEARTLAERALETRRSVYGDDHPRIASSLESLASVLRLEGRLEDSVAHLQEALAMRRRTSAPTDTELLIATHTLALTLQNMGRYEESMALYREELVRLDEIFPGADHIGKGVALFNLSTILTDLGEMEEALELAQANLEMLRRLMGDRHPRTAPSWLNVGRVQRAAGDLEASERDLRFAVEVFDETRPPGHPGRPMPRVELGATLTAQGRLREAEDLLRPALAELEGVLPDTHPRRALASRFLGSCLVAQGRYDEAEGYLLASHDALRARGETVPGLRQTRAELANLYRLWGRPDAAARFSAIPESIPPSRAGGSGT